MHDVSVMLEESRLRISVADEFASVFGRAYSKGIVDAGSGVAKDVLFPSFYSSEFLEALPAAAVIFRFMDRACLLWAELKPLKRDIGYFDIAFSGSGLGAANAQNPISNVAPF